MTEEKQIEEMANEVCIECKHLMYCNEELEKECTFRMAADVLYHAGYRKQTEGEWIDADICAEDMYCSVCGGIAPVDCEKEEFYKSDYCPNCGAKMKGGAE